MDSDVFQTIILAAILGNIAVSLWNKHVWNIIDKQIDNLKKRLAKDIKMKRAQRIKRALSNN